MNTISLKKELENLEEIYKEDDSYFIWEESANKFNFKIFNKSEKYIENASIELKFNKKNIFVCESIHEKPIKNHFLLGINSNPSDSVSLENINYPKVKETENEYVIMEELGDIKHQIEQNVFKVPLRIINTTKDRNSISINIRIFGKNLKSPIKDKLTFLV